jgi:signal transduction histidine kinase
VEPSSSYLGSPAQAEQIEPRPRLVLRFAIYTGIVLLAAGFAILWIVQREVADRAERVVENQSRAVAEETLRRQLRPSDFAAPVSTERRDTLDSLFRTGVLIPGAVGARLINRRGTITYAARHRLIGTHIARARELSEVFAGASRRDVRQVVPWRGGHSVKALRSAIPVRPRQSAKAVGVLELDQDYRAAGISIGDARNRLALILALALLALYVSLFPILRRVTSQLEARNRRLREHAEDRGRLLDGERAARAEAEAVQRLLFEQNERLRELDALKDDFVSLVSHELRTPLTSIRGYVELLLEEEGELTQDQQRRFLLIVDRNSQRLLGLVSDLLFLAQIEAGKLAIEVGTVQLDELVEECIEASAPVADTKGVDLNVSADRLPEMQGDATRLAQALDNLVSNALKFTPTGGRVDVRLKAEKDVAVLEVEDTGLGIPADEQHHLFERFFRSSRATENAIPGTGLGLTITKAIVERHGGRIELESTENAGTTVRVELPMSSERKLDVAERELAA